MHTLEMNMVSSSTTTGDQDASLPSSRKIPATVVDEEAMQSMLYRIRQCNRVPESAKKSIMDFVVDGQKLGKVTAKVANLLSEAHDGKPSEAVFEIVTTDPSSSTETSASTGHKILALTENAGTTLESRTEAVKNVMTNLKNRGIITGWRDELYGLSGGFHSPPVLLVERAAAPFLGMVTYGVHINGIVETESKSSHAKIEGGAFVQPGQNLRMWMARRSKTKSKYPGMLDQIVAGGQPAGLGVTENVLKECMEEAGIPDDVTLRGLEAGGAISYEQFVPLDHLSPDHDDYGLVDGVMDRAVQFNYDLTLPTDITPTPVDGEVEEFFKWNVEDIVKSMHPDYHDPLKPNCYICVIDYLLRKGIISPDTPGYLDVLRELRSGDCV